MVGADIWGFPPSRNIRSGNTGGRAQCFFNSFTPTIHVLSHWARKRSPQTEWMQAPDFQTFLLVQRPSGIFVKHPRALVVPRKYVPLASFSDREMGTTR